MHSKQSLEPHFKQLYKWLIFIVAYFEQFLVKDVSLQAEIYFVTYDMLLAICICQSQACLCIYFTLQVCFLLVLL
jgi:hypothetical protein